MADILRPSRSNPRRRRLRQLEVSPTVADDTNADRVGGAPPVGGDRAAQPDDQGAGDGGGRAGGAPLIAEGINVNITLLFGREMYEAVAAPTSKGWRIARAGAATEGAESPASPASSSAASTPAWTSCWTKRSRRATGAERSGSAAARQGGDRNASLAYQSYKRIFAGAALGGAGAKGARKQRLLVGEHQREEPALPRRDVRRGADRRRDDQHDAPVETLRPSATTARRAPAWRSDLDRREGDLADLEATGISLRAVTGRSHRRRHQEVPGAVRQDDRGPGDPVVSSHVASALAPEMSRFGSLCRRKAMATKTTAWLTAIALGAAVFAACGGGSSNQPTGTGGGAGSAAAGASGGSSSSGGAGASGGRRSSARRRRHGDARSAGTADRAAPAPADRAAPAPVVRPARWWRRRGRRYRWNLRQRRPRRKWRPRRDRSDPAWAAVAARRMAAAAAAARPPARASS